MGRTDSASRVIGASPERLYAAFTDPVALAEWLPPRGMTGAFEWFDPVPGGGYRMRLTYEGMGVGKTTSDSDVVSARFVELQPGRRLVQEVEFVADDPALAGIMVMTWSLEAVDEGTLVTIRADDVPPGISEADHAQGMAASLENLAAYVDDPPAGS